MLFWKAWYLVFIFEQENLDLKTTGLSEKPIEVGLLNKSCPAPQVLSSLLGHFWDNILEQGSDLEVVLWSHSGSEHIASKSLYLIAYSHSLFAPSLWVFLLKSVFKNWAAKA